MILALHVKSISRSAVHLAFFIVISMRERCALGQLPLKFQRVLPIRFGMQCYGLTTSQPFDQQVLIISSVTGIRNAHYNYSIREKQEISRHRFVFHTSAFQAHLEEVVEIAWQAHYGQQPTKQWI